MLVMVVVLGVAGRGVMGVSGSVGDHGGAVKGRSGGSRRCW